MAKVHDENFSQLLEKAKLIAQQGKKRDAIRSVLKHMNLSKDENNPDLYHYISNGRLAEMLGILNPESNGRSDVWNTRQSLIQERSGPRLSPTQVLNKVDSSGTEVIGEGNESVYLYYFPTYKLYAESEGKNQWQCNVGKTKDPVEGRVASQIGGQLPEKATLALVMQTNDCETLETQIHRELKDQGKDLDPKSDADVIGIEWFSTNPAEVKDIFDSLKLLEEERNTEYMIYQQAKKFLADSASRSKEELEKMSAEQLTEYAEKYRRNSEIVKEYESNN
ncbi:MAG: GIY-YIG nuclease family protein [Candidatus Poribacteria bacterium]|nr:GIY-YIG nuclease family protein [Candidatus Poribacteria bacterium]